MKQTLRIGVVVLSLFAVSLCAMDDSAETNYVTLIALNDCSGYEVDLGGATISHATVTTMLAESAEENAAARNVLIKNGTISGARGKLFEAMLPSVHANDEVSPVCRLENVTIELVDDCSTDGWSLEIEGHCVFKKGVGVEVAPLFYKSPGGSIRLISRFNTPEDDIYNEAVSGLVDGASPFWSAIIEDFRCDDFFSALPTTLTFQDLNYAHNSGACDLGHGGMILINSLLRSSDMRNGFCYLKSIGRKLNCSVGITPGNPELFIAQIALAQAPLNLLSSVTLSIRQLADATLESEGSVELGSHSF